MPARIVWVYLGLGVTTAVLHWRLPTDLTRGIAWDLIAVAAAVGAWIGVARNRPSDPWSWRLLALGVTLLAAGDVLWDVSVFAFGAGSASVPQSDIVYLSAYPFLALGLLRMARHRAGSPDAFVDGTVVALVLAVPLWQLVVRPTVDGANGSTFDAVVTVAYPLMDIVLVVAVAYLVFSLSRWPPAAWLLVAGVLVNAVGDIVYARLSAEGVLNEALWLDPMWPLSYTLLAAAMLHPSMRELTVAETKREGLDRARVSVLALALLVVPAAIAVQIETGSTAGIRVLALLCVAISVLVGWRLVRLVRATDEARQEIARNEENFRALVQHASDAVMVCDAIGVISYMSPGVERLLGEPPEYYPGRDLRELIHPDDLARVESTGAALLRHPERTFLVELRTRHGDGSWRWTETACTNHLDEPAVRGIVGNFRDVTERKRTEAIDAAESRVLSMIASGVPITVSLEELVAAVDQHIGDRTCSIRVVDESTRTSTTIAPGASAAGSMPGRWCVPIAGTGATRRVGELTVHAIDETSPSPTEITIVERLGALAAVAIDRAEAEDRLEHQAFHDPLTGLPNRVLLLDRLGQALLRLGRHEQGNVAVLFLDLDRFKVINDSLGHDMGDELLVDVGTRLVAALQASDTVARFGGDEFVVVCERVSGVTDARAVAERLATALAEPYALSRGGLVVATASIGIALGRGPRDRPESLLRDADAAMYRAKERGRSRIEVFDAALRSHVVVRLETERALRRAIERRELRVHYQPVIDLEHGHVVGAEALVRWHHPTRGLVGPSQFIDIAEETGLIVRMGEFVLGEACTQLQHLAIDPDRTRLVISVNLSGRQLARPDLLDRVRDHLATTGIDPTRLCLEVTESVLLGDVDTSVAALRGLKDLGVWLAVDDFGTGYSSLGYLKQFPFDLLKLDQAFVAGLGSDDADDAIVLATAQMAHALGMQVVAEGVETARQRDRAHALGCDLAQGYLFAPPGIAEDVFGPRLRAMP